MQEDESYNHIAGWELPLSWVTEVPKTGFLSTTYTTISDGCKADMPLRKDLRQYVLTWC